MVDFQKIGYNNNNNNQSKPNYSYETPCIA